MNKDKILDILKTGFKDYIMAVVVTCVFISVIAFMKERVIGVLLLNSLYIWIAGEILVFIIDNINKILIKKRNIK